MPAWNPLPTLPPRRFPLAHLGATALSLGWSVLYLALGRGPHNDVETAGPRSAGRLPQAAPVLDDLAFSDARAALLLPRPNPKARQFQGGKLARIVKWHVACYEQLKHGRDVPRPALRR